jgi:hypothetical protein
MFAGFGLGLEFGVRVRVLQEVRQSSFRVLESTETQSKKALKSTVVDVAIARHSRQYHTITQFTT